MEVRLEGESTRGSFGCDLPAYNEVPQDPSTERFAIVSYMRVDRYVSYVEVRRTWSGAPGSSK